MLTDKKTVLITGCSSGIGLALAAKHPKVRYLAAVPFTMKVLMSLGDETRDRILEAAIGY